MYSEVFLSVICTFVLPLLKHPAVYELTVIEPLKRAERGYENVWAENLFVVNYWKRKDLGFFGMRRNDYQA